MSQFAKFVAFMLVAGSALPGFADRLFIASTTTMYEVQANTGNILNSFPISNEGPMAVTSAIKMHSRFGNVVSTYALDGTFLGNQTAAPLSYNGWDGTTDGITYNYAIPNSAPNTTMYRYDLNWENETPLFTFSNAPNTFGLGVAYDTSDNTLWVANDVPGNDIKHFSLSGVPLGGFTFTGGNRPGALAYERSSDTLWFLTESGNNLLQYSKSGSLLSSVVVNGLDHNYNMEFVAGVPEPGSFLLVIIGALLPNYLHRCRHRI